MNLKDIQLVVLDPGGQRIFTCDGNGENVKTLRDGLTKIPDGIIVDPTGRYLYFTQMGEADFKTATDYGQDGEIWRCDIDGSNAQLLVGHGQTRTPKQITADWDSGKLYWCDREGLRVMRANLDGSHVETLVQTGVLPNDETDHVRWCVGIAVDPGRRQFYWTQKGDPSGGHGRIFRAGYDLPPGETPFNRSDIEVLFSHLPEPIDLDLDLERSLLWWTDRGNMPGGNSLCRASVSKGGTVSKHHDVVLTGLAEAIASVIIHEAGIVYSTAVGGELFRSHLNTGKVEKIGTYKMLTGMARLA